MWLTQVVLICLIVLALPHTAPRIFGGGQSDSLTEVAEGKATRISASAGAESYSVIFDAGSTGSGAFISCTWHTGVHDCQCLIQIDEPQYAHLS